MTETPTITTHRAKAIIKTALEARQLPFTKLTARTVSFMDLARCGCIFVKVHGWTFNPEWEALRSLAVQNGFRIET